ncbi:hypothetical protein [Clostridium sp.]|uniref:hypothetical protein n=1 Tax=Clostridium sp. TaxID=1506 RepID=UPI001A4AEA28|nr:hypothetical protein [Clostridium sp.]MBK5236535.1 hypothetical protein [Clostridium sp.]
MIVKIKCKQCKGILVLRRSCIKDARNVKRDYKNKNYVCGRCKFGIMANKIAKEIVKGAKKYDTYR